MNCIEKQLKVQRYLFIFTTVIFLAFAVLNPYFWLREEIRWRNVQTWQKLPATGKTMLDHRPDNQWTYLLGILFFGGFAIHNIIPFAKLKKFDSRTVPAELAELLQPVPELPPRLTVRGHFIYKTMLDAPAIPGKVFYVPKKIFSKSCKSQKKRDKSLERIGAHGECKDFISE